MLRIYSTMEQEFQTSFIPKKPLSEDRIKTRSSSVSFFNLIAIVIFLGALAAAGSVYFLKVSTKEKIKTAQASLQKAKEEFELDTVNSLQHLDKRLEASKDLLSGHIVLSPIFADLSQYTLKTIQFTKFSYSLSGTTNRSVDIKMSGIARDYNALAYQADIFSNYKYFKNPVFSNLSLNDKNQILFDLTFSVDENHIQYEKNLPEIKAEPSPSTAVGSITDGGVAGNPEPSTDMSATTTP